ncbi:MAG: hypothetical protein PHS30_01775 [Bacteroidales bacterium]|nr:hypothetical protein [Bacteroidales bacterium]
MNRPKRKKEDQKAKKRIATTVKAIIENIVRNEKNNHLINYNNEGQFINFIWKATWSYIYVFLINHCFLLSVDHSEG